MNPSLSAEILDATDDTDEVREAAAIVAETDAELIGRFLEKADQEAFAAIVRRHQALVMGVALRYVRERHRADDVFQATFLILAENARKIRRRVSLASWLHGVARRLALRALKERRRQPLEDMAVEPAVEDPELQRVGEAFDQQQIDEAFNSLSEKYRAPLLLHYLEGLTAREVADRLHVSLEAVESRLRRGRDQLRRQLMKQGITLAALVAVADWTPVFAQEAATEALVESTAIAATAWATQTPLTGCTPQAAHLAGKELASMTATNLMYAVAATAVLGLSAGLTLAQVPFSNGTGDAVGTAVDTTLPTGADASESSLPIESGIAVAQGQETFAPGPTRGTTQPAASGNPMGPGDTGGGTVTYESAVPSIGKQPLFSPEDLKGYRNLSPRRLAIEQALEQEIGVEFVDTPLTDVLDYLSQNLSIPVTVDAAALESEGVDPTSQLITLSFQDLEARNVLGLLCDRLENIDYVVKHDVLTITSRSQADSHYEVVVYEMRPFAPLTPVDVQKVLESSTHAAWQSLGEGEGTMVPIPGALVIRQTQRGHREVVEILDQLAKFVNRKDLGEPSPLPDLQMGPSNQGGGMGGMGGGFF